MGKRQVRVIAVRKSVTVALLALTSAAMATLVYVLSGRAYAGNAHPFAELTARLLNSEPPLSRDAVLATLMPVLANVFLFVPWGFFAFIAFDTASRPRSRSY